ncbi:GNAT family N-acetyltransferase [Longispora albida]|uniref:GNAT family N-acetyltransferase n=1 Tax=Longispora albida TaxID=203523 RepID=UPI0003A8EAD9|nr:GNAT family N-acetyltransferase [Longispora albida]
MILYAVGTAGLVPADLAGFFAGWPAAPTPEQHLAVLDGSYRAVIARDGEDGPAAGFVNLISDGVLTGFIPWLEVRPEYQGRGIGQELVRLVLAEAAHLYSVDLVCDAGLKPYYEKLGLFALTGMAHRNRGALGG